MSPDTPTAGAERVRTGRRAVLWFWVVLWFRWCWWCVLGGSSADPGQRSRLVAPGERAPRAALQLFVQVRIGERGLEGPAPGEPLQVPVEEQVVRVGRVGDEHRSAVELVDPTAVGVHRDGGWSGCSAGAEPVLRPPPPTLEGDRVELGTGQLAQ